MRIFSTIILGMIISGILSFFNIIGENYLFGYLSFLNAILGVIAVFLIDINYLDEKA